MNHHRLMSNVTTKLTKIVIAALFCYCAAAALVGSATAQSRFDNVGLEIYVLDVGQGDATLVIGPAPARKVLLIDAGEEISGPKTHYKDVAQKLRELLPGRNEIDYFVISHYHFDHMGSQQATGGNGLFGLVTREGFRIGTLVDRGDEVQFGEPTGPHEKLQDTVQSWISAGKLRQRVTATLGTGQIDLGSDVTIEVVAVNGNGLLEQKNEQNPGHFANCPPSENDYSVALKITHGDFEYYTGGDLGGKDIDRNFGDTCTSYHDMETSIADKIGNIEVMKINHHGSEFSSNAAFLRTLAPEFMVVTSGTRNTYEHPNRSAMERATQFGIVFITGGVSPQEWSRGLLPQMTVVADDVIIYVEAGGRHYEIGGEIQTSFSDAEEASGADRAADAHRARVRNMTRRLVREQH